MSCPVHGVGPLIGTVLHVGVSEQALGRFPLGLELVVENEPSDWTSFRGVVPLHLYT